MNKQGLYQKQNAEVKENVVAGIVGAFLFSLVGGALWFVIYMFGFIAGISGLVGAVCAIKGYSVFAKKESMKGIIISVIISLLVIALAWYMGLAYDIYQVYQVWFAEGEIDFTLTYVESVINVPYFLSIPEVAAEAIMDLVLGIVFCIIGGGSYVVNKIKNAKNNAKFAPAHAAESVNDVAENAGVNDFAVPATEEAAPETEPEKAEEVEAAEADAEQKEE